MNCRKCGDNIPSRIKIDGISHVIASRTHCLSCIPWKTTIQSLSSKERSLRNCKKFSSWRKRKIKESGEDPISARAIRKRNFVIGLTAGCQICKYNRCRDVICFHHVRNKEFPLTVRKFQHSAEVLLKELRKCVILCHNCHTEHHAGILSHINMQELNQQFSIIMERNFSKFKIC
jgi:hypothetical protein